MTKGSGRSAAGAASGCEASPSAASSTASSQSRIPNAMVVYAAAALAINPRSRQSSLAARLSFVSEADALGKAIKAVEEDGYEIDGYHTWWEELPASGMPLRENNEDCSRPKAGSPTAEGGDAQP